MSFAIVPSPHPISSKVEDVGSMALTRSTSTATRRRWASFSCILPTHWTCLLLVVASVILSMIGQIYYSPQLPVIVQTGFACPLCLSGWLCKASIRRSMLPSRRRARTSSLRCTQRWRIPSKLKKKLEKIASTPIISAAAAGKVRRSMRVGDRAPNPVWRHSSTE